MIGTLLTKLMGGGIAVSLLAAGVQTRRANSAADEAAAWRANDDWRCVHLDCLRDGENGAKRPMTWGY